MDIKQKVQSILDNFNTKLKVEEVQMATATLDSGQVIQTDADAFTEGANVFIVNDEGEQIPLPDGGYVMEDGTQIVVVEGVIGKAEAEEMPEETSADLAEVIRPIVAEMLGAALQPILEKLEEMTPKELAATPKPLKRTPAPKTFEKVDLSAMSVEDRIKILQKQFSNL
jgi:hypothetical protein